MTTKTLTGLIIAAMLAGSAVAAVEVAASLTPAPDSSDFPLRAGSIPSDGALLLPVPTTHRFAAGFGGLKRATPGIVRIVP